MCTCLYMHACMRAGMRVADTDISTGKPSPASIVRCNITNLCVCVCVCLCMYVCLHVHIRACMHASVCVKK